MLTKKTFITLIAALTSLSPCSMHGQNEKKNESQSVWKEADVKAKIGGYLVGKYDWNDRRGTDKNGGFDLRFVRLYVDGHCFRDFYFKLQAEVCGEPGDNSGPRILDAFVEWQKWKEMRIKLGQFKRPFTFENPYSPWNVGFGGYSQVVSKLSGFTDRVGEHSSGGRDLGVQVQGDLIPASNGKHRWIHYQVGLFNGQGINHSDKNKFKDLIGGLWLAPTPELSIGGFGWMGRYVNEDYSEAGNMLKEVKRNRWGVGVKYESDWTFRSEYIASEGKKTSNSNSTNNADGWYAALGVPVSPKLKIYGKWDCYRDNKEWSTMKTIWGVTANYLLGKNLLFQANYSFTHDKSVSFGQNYNTIDLQIYARF